MKRATLSVLLQLQIVLSVLIVGATTHVAQQPPQPPQPPPRVTADWLIGTWDVTYQDAILGPVHGQVIVSAMPDGTVAFRYVLKDPRDGTIHELTPTKTLHADNVLYVQLPRGGPSASGVDGTAEKAATVVTVPVGAELRATLGDKQANARVIESPAANPSLRLVRDGERLAGHWTVRRDPVSGFAGTRAGTKAVEVVDGTSFDTMRGEETWERALLEPQLISIVDANGQTLHRFGPTGPYQATVVTAQPAPQYALRFRSGHLGPTGMGQSSDKSILEFLESPTLGWPGDEDGIITLPFVARQDGQATVTVTADPAGRAASTMLTVTVSSVDMAIDRVPEFAEFAVGGFVPVNGLKEVRLTFPPPHEIFYNWQIVRVGLQAPEGESKIEVWAGNPIEQIKLPAKWEPDKAPRTVYVKGMSASDRVGDVRLVLSAIVDVPALQYTILGKDEVLFTVVDLDIEFPGIAEAEEETRRGYIGVRQLRGDRAVDDALDTTAAAGRLPRTMKTRVRPQLPLSVGRVELQGPSGIAAWRGVVKGPTTTLLDGQNLLIAALAPPMQNGDVGVQAHTVESRPRWITLEFIPEIAVAGKPESAGAPIRDRVQVVAAQAEIDIPGVPDDREYQEGGTVLVVSGDPADERALTPLDLLIEPSPYLGESAGGQPFEGQLQIIGGASKIHLWDKRGDRLQRVEMPDGKTARFPGREFPRQLFVQGKERSKDREVEIWFSVAMPPPAGLQAVHIDAVRLTVEGADRGTLRLDPGWIGVPYDPAPGTLVPLSVRLDGGSGKEVQVEAHPETKYQWINAPVEAIPNPFGDDIPLAQLDIDSKGQVTIKSAGVNIIQASHGKLRSNMCLVFAGVQLDGIDIEPERALTWAFGGFGKNPWAVLTADDAALYGAGFGHLHIVDATFKVIPLNRDFSLRSVRKALTPLIKRLPPQVQGLLAFGERVAGAATTIAMDWESQNDEVVSVGAKLLSGWIKSGNPGFTGVTGTLDLSAFSLGKASDTVPTVVLPLFNRFEVLHSDDPPGDHTGAIVIRASEPDTPGTPVNALAGAIVTNRSTVEYEGELKSVLADALVGSFDVSTRIPIGGHTFVLRLRGTAENTTNAAGKPELVFSNVRLETVLPNAWVKWHATEKPARAVVNAGRNGAFIRRGPDADGEPTRVWVTPRVTRPEFLPGPEFLPFSSPIPPGLLASNRNTPPRRVDVQPATCTAGMPVFHLGTPKPQAFAAIDQERFADAPFGRALRLATAKLPESSRPKSHGIFGPTGSPNRFSAGWLYFVEFPVNSVETCTLHLLASSIEVDGEGRDVRNRALVRTALHKDAEFVVGRRNGESGPFRYSLIFPVLLNWQGQHRGQLAVERQLRRVSVFDGGAREYRTTSLWAQQLVFDTRSKTAPPRVLHQVVGASAGAVDPATFNHNHDLDALARFRGIGLPR